MQPIDPDRPAKPVSFVPVLPPIGMIQPEDHALCCKILHDLAQESIDGRDNWIEIASRNRQLFTFGADHEAADDELVLNDIQNAIIATTDIQTKEPPRVQLEPVERGEPPICFWSGPQDIGISMLGLAPEQVASWLDQQGQPQPPQPLSDDQADQIRDAIAGGGIPLAQPGLAMGADGVPVQTAPPMQPIKEDWFIEVNDQLVSDNYQTIHDVYWQRSDFDKRIRANLLETNIDGWTLWLYEFDDDNQRHMFREMSPLQMYIDPSVSDIADAYSAGVDIVLKLATAKRMYPDFADRLKAYAAVGIPRRIDNMTTFGQADDRVVRGGTVTLRIFWIRDQLCPYTAEDAVARGLVNQAEVPDEEARNTEAAAGSNLQSNPDGSTGSVGAAGNGVAGSGGQAGDDEGEGNLGSSVDSDDVLQRGRNQANSNTGARQLQTQPQSEAQEEAGETQVGDVHAAGNLDTVPSSDVGSGLAAGETLPGSPAGATGQGNVQGGPGVAGAGQGTPSDIAVLPPTIPTRTALTHPDTGEEIDQSHPAWPMYYCLRQITQLGTGIIVDDRICEHYDIPIMHNVNIPIPHRPWGIGEPYRLWKLQRARSRVMAAMVDNAEWFGAPATAISQDMADDLKANYKDCHIKPGRTLIVNNELYREMQGKIHTVIDPPAMPDALMKLDPILKDEINTTSGYNEVLQGQPTAQVTSGKMLDSYQAAASSMIGFKSQRTEDMVERLANHCLHSLVWRIDREKFMRIISRFKPWIVDAIIDRAHRIEWDVSVTVTSGTGAIQQRKKQEAQNNLTLGASSMETYREAVGLDDRQEKQRIAKQQKEQQAQAAQMQPGQPMPTAGAPATAAGQNGQASGNGHAVRPGMG